jgi:hypothetical protein
MKTPRITDFDPNAKVPTLKSSLDSMPSIQKRNSIQSPTPQHSTLLIAQTRERQPSGIVKEHLVSQSTKRSFVRRTFDFYDDQIVYLTRQSLQERLAGKEMSMNEMVREALDDWIKKRTSVK